MAAVAITAIGLLYGAVAAGAYPDKPVRFVVAYPPGGSADLIARVIGQRLADALQQPFVIDKRGDIVYRVVGEPDFKKLHRTVERALGEAV